MVKVVDILYSIATLAVCIISLFVAFMLYRCSVNRIFVAAYAVACVALMTVTILDAYIIKRKTGTDPDDDEKGGEARSKILAIVVIMVSAAYLLLSLYAVYGMAYCSHSSALYYYLPAIFVQLAVTLWIASAKKL